MCPSHPSLLAWERGWGWGERRGSMPTVGQFGPYRFFFYANDRGEPRHVHIQRDRNIAKFWLDPVIVEASGGFAAHELREIGRIIRERGKEFSEAWDEFFDLSE